jgi:hypothetical protein
LIKNHKLKPFFFNLKVIVLDINEFAPEVRSILPASTHINVTVLSSQQLDYLIQANTDLIATEGSALVKIEAIDQDSIDLGPEHLNFEIDEVKVRVDSNSLDQMSENLASSGLFTIDLDRQLIIDMDMLRKIALVKTSDGEELAAVGVRGEELFPVIVAFVSVGITDKDEMGIKVTFVVVLVNNSTHFEELSLLDGFMVKKYADNWPSLRCARVI